MIFLDEIKSMRLYNKPFHLPINDKDKKKGSSVFLLTPNVESSVELLKNPLLVNNKYFESYYIEKDITYFINQEGHLEELDDKPYKNVVNENKIIRESANIKKIYFISKDNMDDKTLSPRVPDNYFTKNSYEDGTTPRVCFSTSIDGCLRALSQKNKGEYYVHVAIGNFKTYTPTVKEVPDCKITKEIWVKEKVKVRCIGKIDVTGDKGEAGMPFKYGDKTAELYDWNWNWVEKEGKVVKESLEVEELTKEKFNLVKFEAVKIYSAMDEILEGSSCNKEFRCNFEDDLDAFEKGETNSIRIIRYDDISCCNENVIDEIIKITENKLVFRLSYDDNSISLVHAPGVNLAEATDEVLNNPKRHVRSLKLQMNKAKYELNKLADKERNNVGLEKDSKLNTEKPAPGTATGTQPAPVVPVTAEVKESTYIGESTEAYTVEDTHMRCKLKDHDVLFLFNENLDTAVLNEANVNSTMLYKLLYKERFKNNKEVFEAYDKIKNDIPWITKTFLSYDRYKQFNLFIDLSYYNTTFFKNNIYKLDKGVDLYFEFINRFINDKRLDKAGYTKKTVFVPVSAWMQNDDTIYDFKENLNPISIITRLVKTNVTRLQKWKGIDFIFLTEKGYFKVDLSDFDMTDINKFISFVEKLRKGDTIVDTETVHRKETAKSIVANITSKVEDSQKIKVNNLTGDSGEITKDELIKKIEKAASISDNTSEALDNLEKDDYIKNIIATLASEEEGNVKINAARSSRMNKLNDDFMNKKLDGVSVREMLDTSNDDELPEMKVQVDTVNEEWEHLQYVNFEASYDIRDDIMAFIASLSKKTDPISILDISIEDTSTSEDSIETYSVKMEDSHGERFTLKFDVPKIIGNKFMRLRGNDKTINGQLTQIPICKTDEDTVQIVSNYNKIFISRYGTTTGKSFVVADRIIKTLNKMSDSKQISTTSGDNRIICSKYNLPIDYIDMSGSFSTIKIKDYTIYFNQDELRSKVKIDDKKGTPYAINDRTDEVLYSSNNSEYVFSTTLLALLNSYSTDFADTYETTKPATKYTYSQASILNNKMPLIVIMGYNEGLTKILDKANIVYNLEEKRPKINDSITDRIRFKDGYLTYSLTYSSSLLMNGLKDCNTEDFSLADINSKSMWLEFLDLFGGKILADGLDNFYDMMIDPITAEVLDYYKLPVDYIELLAYANLLLEDNKYFKHGNLEARRYRSNELIAGYVYKSIADSYGRYKTNLKKNKKASMSMKQSEVLDNILKDPTDSDLSILNPILEMESANAVTYKGLAGMNSDRAYSLDKRTFDDSMLNVLGLSTGFAGNVGITRQATMDMNIKGKRGYIKVDPNPDKLSITKTFTATEALTPFGSRRDDPFRTAMTFIQTSKHGMRVKKASPSLISNGADQAMAYMITDTFAHKAKGEGKITEKTNDYMIVVYKDGKKEFIDLRERVQKNSDGGFYLTLKLDSDLKVNSTVKKGQIIAYDKQSFSDEIGHTDDIAYKIGTMTKIAILNTDEGFEDSAVISEWLCDALASDIVVKKDITLPKDTNIYNMVKKGQYIKEGEPLMVFQNAFEEDDVNKLLKTLTDDLDEITDLGRIPIKSKVEGVVEDIKIYRTVEKDELSDSLRKKVNELEKPISDLKSIMKKHDIKVADNFDANYKLNNTGKLKNVDEGVLIEFFLKYEDKMSIGDKVVYYSALKGVIKSIFPEGKEPYTNSRKDEKIHSLLSLGSVNGRMVGSPQIVGGINKFIIELDRKVKGMLDIPFKNLDEE